MSGYKKKDEQFSGFAEVISDVKMKVSIIGAGKSDAVNGGCYGDNSILQDKLKQCSKILEKVKPEKWKSDESKNETIKFASKLKERIDYLCNLYDLVDKSENSITTKPLPFTFNNGGMDDILILSDVFEEEPVTPSNDVESTLSNTLEKLLNVLETAEPVDSFSKHFDTNNQVVFTRQDVLDGKNKLSENREKIIELGLKIKERIDYLCEIRLNDLGLPMNSLEIAVASMVEFSQNEAKKKEQDENYKEKRVFPKYSKIDGSPEDYLRFYFGQYLAYYNEKNYLYLHQLNAIDSKFRNNLRMYLSNNGDRKVEHFVPKKKDLIDKETNLVKSANTDLHGIYSKMNSLRTNRGF